MPVPRRGTNDFLRVAHLAALQHRDTGDLCNLIHPSIHAGMSTLGTAPRADGGGVGVGAVGGGHHGGGCCMWPCMWGWRRWW